MSRDRILPRSWALLGLLSCAIIACGGDDDPASPDGGPGPVGTDRPDAEVPFDPIPDASVPSGMAPDGCEKGFDPADRKLELMLSAEISQVRVRIMDGQVQANEVTCTTKEDDEPVKAADAREIHITGTGTDNLVLIDLSTGEFGAALLAAKPGFVIDLGSGDDTVGLIATSGDDDIRLGSQGGNAQVRFAKDGVQINAAGTDSIALSLGPGNDKVDATSGPLGSALSIPVRALGGEGADAMRGGDGNDELTGGLGNDLFITAPSADGNDVYDGGDDVDTLSYEQRTAAIVVTIDDAAGDGEPGEEDNVLTSVENVIGGTGDDELTGSAANNELAGGEGNDTLSGGDGDDVFHEPASVQGTDIVHGGGGTDGINYSGRTASQRVVVCQPTPAECDSGGCGCLDESGVADERDTLVGVENAITGSGDDELIGDASDNFFVAAEGNDQLEGGAGDDSLYGDAGDDTLLGGSGEDLVYGGPGMDVLDGGPGQGDICVFSPPEETPECELK